MPNAPTNSRIESDLVYWEQHSALFTQNQANLGITSAQAAAVKAAVTAARTAYNAAQAARQAAKNATDQQDFALKALKAVGGSTQNIIKSYIEGSGNTSLWAQAGLEPPAPRGTAPAPNAPTKITANVDSQGNINLTWKATQPAGVTSVNYNIYRGFNGAALTLLDSVGVKKFTDETVPEGTRTVTYAIIAKRGDKQSEFSENLLLRFGRIAGPGTARTLESVTTEPASKVKFAA
jgi:hypothetical protein